MVTSGRKEVEYWKCLSTVSDINEESCRWGWKKWGGGGGGGGGQWMERGKMERCKHIKPVARGKNSFAFVFLFCPLRHRVPVCRTDG